jgi:hypothetical protein
MEIDMVFRLAVLGVATLLALGASLPSALAQQLGAQPMGQQGANCGDRGDVLSQLKDKYKEVPTGFGMTGNGAVVELMTAENGNWTLILSFPSGHACLMAAGEGWELWQARLKGRGA